MKYCVYHQDTGQILRWTSYPEDPPPGCVCEEREFDCREGYIADSVFVLKPPRPSPGHVWDWSTKKWADKRTVDDKWTAVRLKRQELLRNTDWIVTRATEEGTPVPKAWRDYRKALRDITTQPDPDTVVWPVPPSD